MFTTPFTANTHQSTTIPDTQGEEMHAAVPTYPTLWRTWNSRCVMSLTGHDGDERQTPGPTKELIRGSPIPIRARDDDVSSVSDTPAPGSVRKFTMNQFQREFGPCRTYSAPASPLRMRVSLESNEALPLSSPHPQRFVQPTFAAAAAEAVPATLGTGGWRPVTGRFSLDSSSPPRRRDDQQFGDTSTFPSARKPLSALDNLLSERIRAAKFSKSFDESG